MTEGQAPGSRLRASNYRPDIDGLRAVAVLMVVLFHFHLVPYAEAGFLGVDVFFVISGFLITSIIVTGTQTRSFRLTGFYAKRIRRLAPALLATLTLTLCAGAIWLFPVDFQELTFQALVTQFYGSNFYFWRNVNYFGLSADSVYLLHTWSLAVEEQFYLVYPIALLVIVRTIPRLLWPLLWLAGVASFVLNVWFVGEKPEATFYLLPTRGWELLVGAVCYQLVEKRYDHSQRAMEGLGLLGLGLIGVSIFAFEPDYSVPGSFAALPVLGAAAVIYSGTNRETLVSKSLGLGMLVYIGRISYPLYLVHWPIDVFARSYFPLYYGTEIRTAMFGLSLAVASLIYHFVESPIRSPRGASHSRSLLAVYALSLAATVGVFLISEATGGLPGRFPSEVVRMMEYAEDHTESSVECGYDIERGVAASLCVIGREEMDPTWMIYGDSHAWAARTLFDEWLKGRGESGRFVYRNSCPPVAGLYLFGNQSICHRFNEEAVAMVLQSERIENVLLVSTWRQAIETRLSDSPTEMIGAEERIALMKRQFAETVSRYSSQGKRVHVWEPLPGAKANVPRSVARAMLRGHADPGADLRIATQDYRSTYSFFFESVQENQQWIAQTYSPSALLCDAEFCASMLDGKPVYFDGSHLTKSLFAHWVRMMEESDRAAAVAPRSLLRVESRVKERSLGGRDQDL